MDEMVKRFERLWCSERLVYKAMDETDECKNFIYKVNSDPVVSGLGMPSAMPVSKQSTDEVVSQWLKKTYIALLICLPKQENNGHGEKVVAGEPIGYMTIAERGQRAGAISICLGPEFQNKGYGREAINWMVDWAFEYWGLHRVAIGTVSYNERALHLYRDVGFVEEGRKREIIYLGLKWHDLIDFSMLVDEWKTLRGR